MKAHRIGTTCIYRMARNDQTRSFVEVLIQNVTVTNVLHIVVERGAIMIRRCGYGYSESPCVTYIDYCGDEC